MRAYVDTKMAEHARAEVILVFYEPLLRFPRLRIGYGFRGNPDCPVRTVHLAQPACDAFVVAVLVVGHGQFSAVSVGQFERSPVFRVLLGDFSGEKFFPRDSHSRQERSQTVEKSFYIIAHGLKMQIEYNNYYHQQQVGQSYRNEVLPFEGKYLVDSEPREGPFYPHEKPYDEKCLGEEPDEARNVVHYLIESVESRDMQRHPASEENGRGDARYDEEVDEFGDVEKSEMHSGIFGMVSGGKFGFGLRKVERPPVHLGIACDEVDDERDDCRDMAFEKEPAVSLPCHYFGKLHCVREDDDRKNRKPYRQFVAYHLRSASHRPDEGKFAVRAPACQQYADDSDGGGRYEEQDSDVEVENLHTFINRYAGEGHYRCKYYHVRGEVVKELVRMPYRNDFLGKHLEDVAEYLQRAPFPDPVRTEAALEGRADLALHVNHYDGYDYVQQQEPYPYCQTFNDYGERFRHYRSQLPVYPICYNTEIKHIFCCIVFFILTSVTCRCPVPHSRGYLRWL